MPHRIHSGFFKNGVLNSYTLEVEEKDKSGKVNIEQRTFILPVTKGPVEGRIKRGGLELDAPPRDGMLDIADTSVASKAGRARLDINDTNRLIGIEVRNAQSVKQWFALPGLVLLALVIFWQRRWMAQKA